MELGLLFAAAAAIGFYQFTGKLIMWVGLVLAAAIVLVVVWPWPLIFFAAITFMYFMGEFDE